MGDTEEGFAKAAGLSSVKVLICAAELAWESSGGHMHEVSRPGNLCLGGPQGKKNPRMRESRQGRSGGRLTVLYAFHYNQSGCHSM